MIYITTDFEAGQTAASTLLIGVGATSNRLAVVDEARHLLFAADYDPASPTPEVSVLLDRDFAAVKIAVSDCRYTLIPADVYDEGQRDTYLRYLPFDGVGTTQVAAIAPLRVNLLHQTNRVGMEALTARFPGAEHYPQVLSLLYAVASQPLAGNGPVLVIERHAPWITIAAFDQGSFLYCNDFECTTDDDFTYHLLSVVQLFGLADRQPTVLLAGDIEQGDDYYARAASYGATVALADGRASAGVHVPDGGRPHQHRFLSLFGLFQCAS